MFRPQRFRAVLPAVAALAAAQPALAAVQTAPAPRIGAECYDGSPVCMTLAAVSLEGLTVYKPGELAPLYDQYLTHDVGPADLAAIAEAITARYRKDGYFLSRAVVPPQLRGGHMARIQIYEGYVDRVDIKGAGSPAAARTLKALASKRPLRLADLDRALSLASDVPGLRVKSHLEPDLDNPARHRLVAETTTRKLEGSAYVDNRGPKTAGPWQAYLRGAVNSALIAGDQIALALLTVPFNLRSFVYGEAAYSAPVGSGGDRVRAAFSAAKARDGADPISQDVGSDSWAANLSYLKPLWRSRRLNTYAQLTGTAREVEQEWNTGGRYRDKVMALRGMINATFTDPGRSTNLWAQLTAGKRGGDDAALLSRADAAKDFTKLNLHAAHYRDLGQHAGLYLSADGQYSRDGLLASEEFIVGGAPYGRGYNYAAIGGDSGLVGTAELRAGFKPNIKGISFIQGYGFVDAGKVWNRGPGGDYEIASTGVGMRVRVNDKATIGVEAAKPLKKVPWEPDNGWKPYLYISAAF